MIGDQYHETDPAEFITWRIRQAIAEEPTYVGILSRLLSVEESTPGQYREIVQTSVRKTYFGGALGPLQNDIVEWALDQVDWDCIVSWLKGE